MSFAFKFWLLNPCGVSRLLDQFVLFTKRNNVWLIVFSTWDSLALACLLWTTSVKYFYINCWGGIDLKTQ